jgi:hypothetical protein
MAVLCKNISVLLVGSHFQSTDFPLTSYSHDVGVCFAWLIRFWIEWLDLLTPYTNHSELQAIQRYRYSTHFIVTVPRALGFSVFTSRILASGFITVSLSFQITKEVFLSEPNSFLAIILQLPIPKIRLNSIPLLPSSCPGRLASRISTQFFSTELFFIAN